MKVKLVKFRDMLTDRINKYGGRNSPCVKAGTVNVQMGEEDLTIESITGYGLTSEIYINVKPKRRTEPR